jgi:hypothetical protein
LATYEELAIASMKLQATSNIIDNWANKFIIKIHQNKYTNITYPLSNQTCPAMPMANVSLGLCMHLDRRLTWAKHIKTKRNQST